MGRVSLSFACLCALLAVAGCGDDARPPLLGAMSGGNSSGGAEDGGASTGGKGNSGGTHSGGSKTGGSHSGGAASGGSHSGGSSSGGNQATGGSSGGEDPDHPMYFLGDSASGGYAICDVFSGASVVSLTLSSPYGFTDPTSGHLIYFDYATSTVKDAQAAETLGTFCLDADPVGFAMSADGDVYPYCPSGTNCVEFIVDSFGNTLCPYEQLVTDDDGSHPLSEELDILATHTKPAGGFWAVTNGETGLERWSIAPNGESAFDGQYADYAGATLNDFALDENGAAYATAVVQNTGGIIRFSADFATAELVMTDDSSSCKLRYFTGALFSTP